jgi:enoyl-CoA hydratase/carnithine racemase
MCADIVVAAESATIADAHANFGGIRRGWGGNPAASDCAEHGDALR